MLHLLHMKYEMNFLFFGGGCTRQKKRTNPPVGGTALWKNSFAHTFTENQMTNFHSALRKKNILHLLGCQHREQKRLKRRWNKLWNPFASAIFSCTTNTNNTTNFPHLRCKKNMCWIKINKATPYIKLNSHKIYFYDNKSTYFIYIFIWMIHIKHLEIARNNFWMWKFVCESKNMKIWIK